MVENIYPCFFCKIFGHEINDYHYRMKVTGRKPATIQNHSYKLVAKYIDFVSENTPKVFHKKTVLSSQF